MKIKIVLAGATGWVGKSLSIGIHQSPDLELISAVAPEHARQSLGEVLGYKGLDVVIALDVATALNSAQADVFIDFTTPNAVKQNVMTALVQGVHVIVGTSGLTAQDYADIRTYAQ